MNKKYKEYLKSKEWSIIKIELYNSRGRKCERCGNKNRLHIHHKTYKNIFNEEPSDLEILCSICHEKEHGIVVKGKVKYLPSRAEPTPKRIERKFKKNKKTKNKVAFINLMPQKKWKSKQEKHDKWLKLILKMCIDEREKNMITEMKMIPFGLKQRLKRTGNGHITKFKGYK